MKTKVRLFINSQELEFTGKPSVLYNYNLDSVSNPTAVKNQYTKTVQVEGTPRNNKIFGEIWDLTRMQTETDFNPSKRTPFELYIDGELYETGYVKLNTISRTHNKIVYNITLYGGIGDFLYNLSYRDDGEQLRLRDMIYTTGDPTTELDFKINQEAVYGAWMKLFGDGNNPLWDVINFAPCYNGYPNDFDSDKVLIYASGMTSETRVMAIDNNIVQQGQTNGQVVNFSGFPTSITGESDTYTTYNGYGYGELNGQMTEWDMRDLRSYLQRPVLRMKKFIEACCDPAQNGGYEVELDNTFFNTGNTYYENAWMTLNMLNEMKYDSETIDPWSGHTAVRTNINTGQAVILELADDTTRGSSVSSFEITFRPRLWIPKSWNSPTGTPLYCASMIGGEWNACAWVYQLVGKDYQGNYACGSDMFSLTTDINGRYLNIATESGYQPFFAGGSIYNRLGYYTYYGEAQGYFPGSPALTTYRVYEWGEDITLRMSTNGARVEKICIVIQPVANLGYSTNSYEGRRGRMYSATTLNSAVTNTNCWTPTPYDNYNYTGNIAYANGAQVNSNAVITKQNLLGIDGTPCDYLVGYLKTFGLYLRKDPLQKKIQILTRPNYYRDIVENWEERIDHTKQISITPLTFKKKWYNFNHTQKDRSAVEDKYYNKYGTNYGTEKVNTGYNFDSETEELLKGIKYNNAADALEKSAYFTNRYVDGAGNYPTCIYSWMTYSLMKSGSDETGSVMVGSSLNFIDANLGTYGELYDQFSKPQFHNMEKKPLDGSGVLLFYNGPHYCKDVSGNNVTYGLSDDVNEMFKYGDNACWLLGPARPMVALPLFQRCYYQGSSITRSWDFGATKELYTPYTYYQEKANIYDKWWKLYINDLFDVNTRVCEAFVRLPKTQGDTLLRKFYWFDNSLWRINKISDWDVCSEDTTKVEFVKVQSKANYLFFNAYDPANPEEWICTVQMSPSEVPASGGTITFTVYSNQVAASYPRYYEWITYSDNYGNETLFPVGTSFFTAEIQANTTSSPRTFTIGFVNSLDIYRFWTFTQNG